MEARPTYEFYIPSIYDDTALACRIYTLPELYFGGVPANQTFGSTPWTPRGAVIAHPYPRFGGSYDDGTVLQITAELLRLGFTVGTFNYRGVGKSKGKSTWSSKAELQDYISFVGFFMYYLSNLYPPVPGSDSFDDYFSLAPVLSGVPATRPPAHLLLAGYSYGALLTRHLPGVTSLLNRFSKVLKTSTEAEIRMRASRLAIVTTIDILSRPLRGARDSQRTREDRTPEAQNGQAGAPETATPDWPHERKEHLKILQTPFVRKEKKNSWPDQQFGMGPSDDDYIARVDVPTPKAHYLLISLLLEPVSLMCTGFRKLAIADEDGVDYKFLDNTTLVLHGAKDRWTSWAKLCKWSDYFEDNSGGKFRVAENVDVGHFWQKENDDDLRVIIRQWVLKWLIDDV